MSAISETYDETWNKPTNLPQSFGNLGDNIYVPFLLLIITLHFTGCKRKDWWNITKFQNNMITVNHGPWKIFSNKKYFVLTLRPRNTCTFFKHYLVIAFLNHFLLLQEDRTKVIEFYTKLWAKQATFWRINIPAKLPLFLQRF